MKIKNYSLIISFIFFFSVDTFSQKVFDICMIYTDTAFLRTVFV